MASSRVLILTRLDPCLIRLIVTQWAMGAVAEFGQARPELFGSRVNEQDHLKSPGRVREEFGKVRDGFRQEFGWDFRLIRLLSLDLLHFLPSCFDDFYDLVNAIVVHTNWETQVDKLVKIIREGRRVDAESSPSPAPSLSPSLSPSLMKDRAPSESSPSPRRVDTESPPSPKDSTKMTKKAREDSVRVPPESSESSGGPKT